MKRARSSGWNGRVVLLVLLLFGLAAGGAAQRGPGAGASRKPVSIPRQSDYDPGTGRSWGSSRGPGWSRTEQYFDFPAALKLTAAERATVIARLEEFERLFARADAMARPQGFRANPVLQVGGRFVIETGGYGLLASGIGIQLFDGQDPKVGEEAAPVLGAGGNPSASRFPCQGGSPLMIRGRSTGSCRRAGHCLECPLAPWSMENWWSGIPVRSRCF